MDFEDFVLEFARDETSELRLLRFAGGSPAFRESHTRPGQFVAVRPEDMEPGYMAIASPPGAERLELLVRSGGGVADRLRELEVGATLAISHPLGVGFPVADARGRDLWLIGAGSAISALRPVWQVVEKDRAAYGRVVGLFGVRTPGSLAFRAELEAASRDHRLELHLAVSRPDAGWTGGSGWAQKVLTELAPDLKLATVFVCGMKPMVEAVREVSVQLGADAGRVLTNV